LQGMVIYLNRSQQSYSSFFLNRFSPLTIEVVSNSAIVLTKTRSFL
jgi:hypothetical protein